MLFIPLGREAVSAVLGQQLVEQASTLQDLLIFIQVMLYSLLLYKPFVVLNFDTA